MGRTHGSRQDWTGQERTKRTTRTRCARPVGPCSWERSARILCGWAVAGRWARLLARFEIQQIALCPTEPCIPRRRKDAVSIAAVKTSAGQFAPFRARRWAWGGDDGWTVRGAGRRRPGAVRARCCMPACRAANMDEPWTSSSHAHGRRTHDGPHTTAHTPARIFSTMLDCSEHGRRAGGRARQALTTRCRGPSTVLRPVWEERGGRRGKCVYTRASSTAARESIVPYSQLPPARYRPALIEPAR